MNPTSYRLAAWIGLTALSLPSSAQWSHKEGDPAPPAGGILVQPFTKADWEASNFAAEKDLQWFRDAKYGMFIHFGLSTHNNADLSWGVCRTRKPPDTGNGPVADEVWQNWPRDFQFEKFDAGEWVAIARQAGFKYIVAIAKHHDGFHLWDTAFSEFDVMNTPFKRDYLKELADACHAAGMPFGIYYSQRDWHHPDYMPVDPAKANLKGNHWTLKAGETSPMGERQKKYNEYQFNVCRELCTKYGKVDIFWWDAAWWGGMFTAEMWDAEKLTRSIRELQPGILMNNRCSVPGDFDTPEQRLGFYQDWRAWESCMCLTHSWSYSGTPPKPRDQIIQMLVNNACCDGNLLLSWGPHWNGEFDPGEKSRLLEVGAWLTDNGRAIYGTRGGPWSVLGLGRLDAPRHLLLPCCNGRGRRCGCRRFRAQGAHARLLDGRAVAVRQRGAWWRSRCRGGPDGPGHAGRADDGPAGGRPARGRGGGGLGLRRQRDLRRDRLDRGDGDRPVRNTRARRAGPGRWSIRRPPRRTPSTRRRRTAGDGDRPRRWWTCPSASGATDAGRAGQERAAGLRLSVSTRTGPRGGRLERRNRWSRCGRSP
ncbi:MAG: alpha-L-fucosidase [Kiritimatiellia bacterium]